MTVLLLLAVLSGSGCAKVRRGLTWVRYENRVSVFATPIYRIPPGFSSSYFRHLYGDDRVFGEGESTQRLPLEEGSGTFYPASVELAPVGKPEIVRPTVPMPDEADIETQRIISRRLINLLR